MFPRISPDGKYIAFTGQYDGNTEVFVIPSAGGIPRRLTYTATLNRDDLATGWALTTSSSAGPRTANISCSAPGNSLSTTLPDN